MHRAVKKITASIEFNDRLKIKLSRQTDEGLDAFRYVRVGSDAGLVLGSHSELVERVLLELLGQRVPGAGDPILDAAVARPLGRTLHAVLDDVVDNLRAAVAIQSSTQLRLPTDFRRSPPNVT